jgi:dUTP pyrophosphatase
MGRKKKVVDEGMSTDAIKEFKDATLDKKKVAAEKAKKTEITNADKVFGKEEVKAGDEVFQAKAAKKTKTPVAKKAKVNVENKPNRDSLKTTSPKSKKTTGDVVLEIKKLNVNATIPTKAHATDAGWDLYACIDQVDPITGKRIKSISFNNGAAAPMIIPTGISMKLPKEYWGQIEGRSGMACKGLFPLGGIIDNDYRGEIGVIMQYLGDKPTQVITHGDKIAQLVLRTQVISTVVEVDDLDETKRGAKGFGSSGK